MVASASLIVPALSRSIVSRSDVQSALQPDLAFDGSLIGEIDGAPAAFSATSDIDRISPIEPDADSYGARHREAPEPLIFVNGIDAPWRNAYGDAKALANQTGEAVVIVHVATCAFARATFTGTLGDALDALAIDDLDVRTRATQTLGRVIATRLARGEPIHIVAHSKGTIVTARALRDVQPQQRQIIRIETFAAAEANFPDGPQYVHYANTDDIIPMLFGVARPGAHPGAGARRLLFADWRFGFGDWSLAANHHFPGAYLTDERVPFARARELGRKDPLAIVRYVERVARRPGAHPKPFFE